MNAAALRLIVDPPADGAWNMAVDEALATLAAADGPIVVRFYQWREPTLSLGYFQHVAERAAHTASAGCPAVRRGSGGGAIVHDDELTYSLIVPSGQALARRPNRLYRWVHDSLIAALDELGISGAQRHGCEACRHGSFLCFARRSGDDVVLGEAKIAGSAQRRLREAILQHGSVLLGRSAAAPELAGIREASGLSLTAAALLERWLPRIAAALNVRVDQPTELRPEEKELSKRLALEKYGAEDWTFRRP